MSKEDFCGLSGGNVLPEEGLYLFMSVGGNGKDNRMDFPAVEECLDGVDQDRFTGQLQKLFGPVRFHPGAETGGRKNHPRFLLTPDL